MTAPAIPRLRAIAFPSYVTTEQQRQRFEISRAIAEALSAEYEPGMPNSEFVFYMTQQIYSTDIPTGDPSDAAE